LPEISALLPTLTNVDRPMPRIWAWFITARPSAPDCDMNATRPSGGHAVVNVPFSLTLGSVLATPMQFGPISRMPWERHTSSSSS
jgi:hypothetical protein